MTWLRTLWQSTIGKKVVMAVTGFVLFCFVTGHLLGNLQIYIGSQKINEYAQILHASAGILWTIRSFLLLVLLLHVFTAVQLFLRNQAARPIPYSGKRWREASYASRTMIIGGPLLFFFVIYHLLHLTTGAAHPQFKELQVFHNVTVGFSHGWVVAVYLVAQVALGLHLAHGAWSMFQSIGINHPAYTPVLRVFGWVFGVGIALGNISIPLAVLAGFVR